MAYISYEQHGPEYRQLWNTMRIIRDAAELQRLTDKIEKAKDTYLEVEKATGVPWQMVAVMHVREAGEQDIGRFHGVLHNGENIIGTGRKTRLVPAGRGPFNTWLDAAVDAINIKGFQKIKEWPVERQLWALEPFNGYGYRNKGLRSPYLWASTNHQQPGKYIADHVFDPTVMDRQIGCAALLRYLGVGKKPSGVPVVVGGGILITGSVMQLTGWIAAHQALILSGLGLVVLLSAVGYYWFKNRKNENVKYN